jgi:hypothetical protein
MITTTLKTVLTFTLIMGLIACNQSSNNQITQEEMNKIIETQTSELKTFLIKGDLNGLMTLYDQNRVIQSKKEIGKFLSLGMKMAKFSKLEMKTDFISGSREFIYQMGIMKSQLIVSDSLYPEESVKFFYLWKLQDDSSYKIAVEMSNNVDQDVD